jgi:GTP:adenosylcobinamide-phosphate guanylyltransferase
MAELTSGRWTAIVAAGERPGVNALAAHFKETSKALISVGGEAMISRVVRCLLAAPSIGRVVIMAQNTHALTQKKDTEWLAHDARVSFACSEGSLSRSLAALTGTTAAPWPVMVTTADHPLLTPAIVEAFLKDAGGVDVAVGMVNRTSMLPRFEKNARTWMRFSDGAFTGANLFAFNGTLAGSALAVWIRAEQSRKAPWVVFSHFGPWLLFRALTRTISVRSGLRNAGARLGIRAKAVILPFAEAGIDVDKLSDHTLAEAILAGEI